MGFSITKLHMHKIKTAIVGMGMGRHHLAGYLKHPSAEIVALVDLDEATAREVGKPVPGARIYSNYREMLKQEQPDLVSIAVPNFLHEEITCAALEAGAHVLCEKPMSVNVESALRMRAKAADAGRKLYINFSQRFSPFARTARGLVDANKLGHIYHAYCQWTRRDGFPRFGGWFGQKKLSGGGPLIDLGVHRLDFVLWLMGPIKPVTVSGITHNRIGQARGKSQGKAFDVEDLAAGLIRTDTGASILFEVSWAGFQVKTEQQVLRLMGEEGSLEGGSGIHGDYTLSYCHDIAGHPFNSTLANPGTDATSYEELIRCLVANEDFPSTAEDGIRLQIILDCLYESACTGREVVVDEFARDALQSIS